MQPSSLFMNAQIQMRQFSTNSDDDEKTKEEKEHDEMKAFIE